MIDAKIVVSKVLVENGQVRLVYDFQTCHTWTHHVLLLFRLSDCSSRRLLWNPKSMRKDVFIFSMGMLMYTGMGQQAPHYMQQATAITAQTPWNSQPKFQSR